MIRDLEHLVATLPQGLTNSLTAPGITIHDQDILTGTRRDPATQIHMAAQELQLAHQALGSVAQRIEAAQAQISGQGYSTNQPERIPQPRQ